MQKPVDTDSIVMLENTDTFDNQDELFVRFECTVDNLYALTNILPSTYPARRAAAFRQQQTPVKCWLTARW